MSNEPKPLTAIREEHPSQQGLRRAVSRKIFCFCYQIREEHPSQQGLRLQTLQSQPLQPEIREEHPSQQGLRPLLQGR